MMRRGVLWSRGGRLLLAPFAALLVLQAVGAQTRYSYSKGQSVSPAYEGWWLNEDGSFTMFFGYMNTNWLEELDVPIGPENNIEPGGPDQGQPTHFYPRRNPFLFTIRVPKDLGTKELIWTLTTQGKTERAYASLKTDYQIDKHVISTEVGGDFGSLRDDLRTNVPPEIKVEGDTSRSVRVGAPLTLVAFAKDPDNIPAKRDRTAQPGRGRGLPAGGTGQLGGAPSAGQQPNPAVPAVPATPANPAYSPTFQGVPGTPAGLRFSWSVYRGKAAAVTFSPEQMKTWMDTRVYANSPWSPPYFIPEPPPENKWTVQATFQEPGTYVLRAVASDGSIFTYYNVTVSVTR